MTKEEHRVTLIKHFIRTRYQMQLAYDEGFDFEPRTVCAIQDELFKLMTDDEFQSWCYCTEFQGLCWSKV